MSRQYAPNDFGDAEQVDSKRWNENVQALRDREQGILVRRWSYFEMTLPLFLVNQVTDAAGEANTFQWKLPYDYEIISASFSHRSAVLTTESNTDRTYRLTLGDNIEIDVLSQGASLLVSGSQDSSQLVDADTLVSAVVSYEGALGTHTMGQGTVTVYCRMDAMAAVSLVDVDKIEPSIDNTLTAAYANAMFLAHQANMAALSAVAYSSEIICIQPRAITTNGKIFLSISESGWTLDQVDIYAEGLAGGITFNLGNDGGVASTATITMTGVGNVVAGSLGTSIGLDDDDGTNPYIEFDSLLSITRAWAVLHFIMRS